MISLKEKQRKREMKKLRKKKNQIKEEKIYIKKNKNDNNLKYFPKEKCVTPTVYICSALYPCGEQEKSLIHILFSSCGAFGHFYSFSNFSSLLLFKEF